MITHRPNRLFYVGVVGAAGVGKDSFARALAAQLPHASIIPFALPIRVLAAAVGGVAPPTRSSLVAVGAVGRGLKPNVWALWHHALVTSELSKDAEAPSLPESDPRLLAKYRVIIVPDVRFRDEVAYIRDFAPDCVLVGLRHPDPARNNEFDVQPTLPTCDFVWENHYVEMFCPHTHFAGLVHDVIMRIYDVISKPKR